MKTKHKSVLLKESIEALDIKPDGVYIDATLGGGGHSKEIIKNLKTGKLLVFDLDADAIKRFAEFLRGDGFVVKGKVYQKDGLEIILENKNFKYIEDVMKENGIAEVDGVIADLGLSTDQYENKQSGISFTEDTKLDMRIDKEASVTASDLLNGLYWKELVRLFTNLADINYAKELAAEIVEYRKQKRIENVSDLLQLIRKVVPLNMRIGTNKHPEAKVFQALRIAVNSELSSLRIFLPLALETLAQGGSMVIISFHSGEDRVVKNFFRETVNSGKAKYIHKLSTPSEAEIKLNRRSRSAKLRAIQKLNK